MRQSLLWLMVGVLIAGALFVREPRLDQSEEYFLRWLLKNSRTPGPMAPLTVVEIGHDVVLDPAPKNPSSRTPAGGGVTPLEFALFLQSILEVQPTVVAFENVLRWRERDQDQEQVFIDQAMRVPRLLLAAELTTTPDPDAPGPEIPGFTHVTGKRGELVEFSGIGRQPREEMRLIGTTGFVNLPEEIADRIHVPLLFRYRGEVIPSFALQAVLLWLRVTPAEVSIDLGSHISLPHNRKIPIRADGTLLISPNAGKKVRRFSMNELLLANQQRDAGRKTPELDAIRDQIVLARTPANPLSPPDVIAATLATIQTNAYIHRVNWVYEFIILLVTVVTIGAFHRATRVDLLLAALAFTAAYNLIALAVLSNWLIWLPGVLPLGALWLLTLILVVMPRRNRADRETTTAANSPV
jgi:hypothetical protein